MLGGSTLLAWSAGCSGEEVAPEAAMRRIRPVTQKLSGQPDHLWNGEAYV